MYIVDIAFEGLAEYISHKNVNEMIEPYIAEAGLSVAIEPSLLRKFEPDAQGFHIDDEFERAEPVRL